MPTVTITLEDTPAGGVAITSSHTPTVGAPCSAAQSAAMEIVRRTKREWSLDTLKAASTKTTERRFWPVPATADPTPLHPAGGEGVDIERIQQEAREAAKVYPDLNAACPYPFGTTAATAFKAEFNKARAEFAGQTEGVAA